MNNVKRISLAIAFLCFCLMGQAQIKYDTTFTNKRDSSFYPCTKITLHLQDTVLTPHVDPLALQVRGIYMHPNDCEIGNQFSENSFLTKCQRLKVNTINMYARTYLSTSSKQAQMAAFVKKAKELYGIIYLSCDIRGVSEIPNWISYQSKYYQTVSKLDAALTEWDVHRDLRYTEFFQFWPQIRKVADQYHFDANFYGGWPGQGWAGGEAAAWDTIVKYTDQVYISNYLVQSQYTAPGGAWDGRMDKRTAWIATAGKRQHKEVKLVEIVSLEMKKWGAGNDFLGNYFSCPSSSTALCKPFYDLTRAQTDYNNGPYSIPLSDVKAYTEYIGRTLFYSKFVFLCNQ